MNTQPPMVRTQPRPNGASRSYAPKRQSSKAQPSRTFVAPIVGALLPFLAIINCLACAAEDPGMTDADCARTYWCTDKGRCHADGDNCVATSNAACEASTECKTAQRCNLRGGACHKPITDPCVGTTLCDQGYCTSNSSGACCNHEGWCCTSGGTCAKS